MHKGDYIFKVWGKKFKYLMYFKVTDSCQDVERSLSEKRVQLIAYKLLFLVYCSCSEFKALELKANVVEITEYFPNIQSSITALNEIEESSNLSQKIGNDIVL